MSSPSRGKRAKSGAGRRIGVALGLGLLVAVAVIGLRSVGALERLELDVYDVLFRATRSEPQRDDRVVLVGVTEDEIREYGYPIDDHTLAKALEILSDYAPRAIGVDLYRDHAVEPGHDELRSIVLREPAIVMIQQLGGEGVPAVLPPPYVIGTSQLGFSDVVPDPDGAVRRALLAVSRGGVEGLSLSTLLALRFLAVEEISLHWETHAQSGAPVLHLGAQPILRFRRDDAAYVAEDDGGYQTLLDYRRGRAAYAHYSFGDLLSGGVPAGEIRGGVVILGAAAASLRDDHLTPFGRIHGIEHHAQVVSHLLDLGLGTEGQVRFLGGASESVLILVVALLGALLVVGSGSTWRGALAWAGGVGFVAAGGVIAFAMGWWLPLVPVALAWAGAGAASTGYIGFAEHADRRRIMELFGRFLDRSVADEIWRQRDAFLDGGAPAARKATITAMMVDLQGYTGASERLEPAAQMAWVNRYLDAMARIVGASGGVVNDYAGDGLMANFGVPLPRESEAEIARDARAAVDCALAMAAEMERLNAAWRTEGLPTCRVRIGLATGEALVGMMGSADRMKYTPVGDTVNTAARLESFDREGFAREEDERTTRILITRSTFERLGDAYEAEPLGPLALKGKQEEVWVFRVLALRDRGENR